MKARAILLLCMLATVSRLSFAEGTADEIYERIIAVQKEIDFYTAQHARDIIERKATFRLGGGVPPDITRRAIEEKKQLFGLAKAGNVRAKHLYGVVHYSSAEEFTWRRDRPDWERDLINQQFKTAETWFRSASDDGYSLSMYMLGAMHANGYGVYQSNYVAIEWYAKAGKSFLRAKERELALKSLEEINKLDRNHPLAKELYSLLYGKHKQQTQR